MLASRRIRRSAGLFAAAALVLAACGGEDENVEETADDAGAEALEEEEVDDGDLADFYDGETIEMIVPFGAGGGVDFNGRFLAEFMAQYLPGNPTIQAINVEGGAGVIGGNQFELQTERDGMTIFISGSSNLINEQFGNPEVRYSTEDWVPFLGVPSGGIASIRTDVELADDFSNIGDLEFITAMREPTGVDTLWLLAYEVLGLDVQPIFGYGGAGDTRVALEQGESNLDWQSTGAYETNVQPLIDEGTVQAFFAAGTRDGDTVVRHEAHPEVPTIAEVYEEIYGEPPSGPAWDAYLNMNSVVLTAQRLLWLHSDDPAEAIAAFRLAMDDMLADDAFLEEAAEVLGPYTMSAGDDLDAIAPQLQVSPDNLTFIEDFLAENYDASF